MTLSRQYGLVVFECDDCGDALETETRDFHEALERLREEGWRTLPGRTDHEWRHKCGTC